MSEARVRAAIEEIKNGKMVVIVDDEDRENEGDLVYAAHFSTVEKVNFMITHAKGLVCMSITEDTAKRLELTPMVANNNSAHETAFTISVDARTAKTGISARERDMTIKVISDQQSAPEDLVRPGHIFPLIAKKGGVLVRTGHTEGSIDLCRLAGVSESAIICEIVKEDGEMARRDDIDIFCKKHNIKVVSITDIIGYRLKYESLVRESSSADAKFLGADVKKIEFTDHLDNIHTAFIFGQITDKAAVKFHHILKDIDLLSLDRTYDSLTKSIEYLKKAGGALIFLNTSKEGDNAKERGIGAQILNALGIRKITLLSKQGGNEFAAMGGFNLDILEEIIL
ncbi:MAG: bifunctional 3,4-dihydroxy-2-butanone 4-phosphate synthase/GTP cyclohydrolase II [Campylobacteraceae bacterium]|jgi:3,4-dihydroxy 2-butanone 4-phosphate synthase/GTP cyclohydrolase II|nr:bifunctional 3,4-dihydroxy-2-butanone 4-phosphate synthase/GTP cyclohydrolase II [Campylobacteraceae bacterium]